MSNRQNIFANGNVQTPAYLELVRLGYHVHCDHDWPGGPIWFPTNDELNFSGDCLAALLGLHYMRSHRGPRWQATDDEKHAFIRKYRRLGEDVEDEIQ